MLSTKFLLVSGSSSIPEVSRDSASEVYFPECIIKFLVSVLFGCATVSCPVLVYCTVSDAIM